MTEDLDPIPVRNDLQTIAFYNVENLFDLRNNKAKHDNDFLPKSFKKWTHKRYQNKLKKLGYAISNIGRKETGKHPAIIGLAEVENPKVIKDLMRSKHLKDVPYNYVHFESLDERGIDVALLYDTHAFKVLHAEAFAVPLTDIDGTPDYTRDVLLVSGILDGEKIHVIVNHWSSRREGAKETEFKRLASSEKVNAIINTLLETDNNGKIMVLGDFNDEPHNKSIFDQILVSTNFFKSSKSHFEFFKANIFDDPFLKISEGRYKGAPYRTYAGKNYKGGYSDHFPVYVLLKK